MRKVNFAIFALLLGFFLSFSVNAQTSPSPKVGYINSDAFYDTKTGITKLINANKQLDTEFGVRIKALQDSGTRIQNLAKELQAMQNLPQNQFVPATFNEKKLEGERLEREYNYKKTELENEVTKRRAQLVDPINKEIGAGIDEFAKKNGYGLIIDMAKMIDAGTVLYFAETADATKDFITFFNARGAARPATASTKP